MGGALRTLVVNPNTTASMTVKFAAAATQIVALYAASHRSPGLFDAS
jgi:Asp/Glu/hydantoin racemase